VKMEFVRRRNGIFWKIGHEVVRISGMKIQRYDENRNIRPVNSVVFWNKKSIVLVFSGIKIRKYW